MILTPLLCWGVLSDRNWVGYTAMLVVLPLTSFFLLVVALMAKRSGLQIAFLAAAVIWGVLIVTSTELLGLAHGITVASLTAIWIGLNAALTGIVVFLFRRGHIQPGLSGGGLNHNTVSFAVAVFAVGIVVVEAIIAFRAPPNTWDAMSYHMSRVAHWIQNGAVAFYPTHILRQNHQMPWAEYAIMHLQVLSGGDRFANMIQWFSMLGSVIGVSVIALELGGRRHVQFLSSIVCLTIPMGILQSTSVKNDYVLSFWSVCFVVFLMKTIREPSGCNTVLTGSSLGLAFLTKGTAYVYATPILVLAILGMKTPQRKRWFKTALILLCIAFIMNAPHYARNIRLYGKPLGPGREGGKLFSYANERLSIPIIVSNMVRNLGLHLTTTSKRVNQLIERNIYALLGNEVNNPASTWGAIPFHVRMLSVHEERAGNCHHMFMIIISAAIVLLARSQPRAQRFYILFIFMAAFSFCVCLRWQPWHNRLHLPLFVLSAPIIAFGVSTLSESRVILNIFCMVMMAPAMLWLFFNASRPLVSPRSVFAKTRIEQYFANQQQLRMPYTGAVDYVLSEGIRNVGLVVNGDDYEYPFWVLLREAYGGKFRIEHVGVMNHSRILATSSFVPEAIIATVDAPERIIIADRGYVRAYSQMPVSVFKQESETR